MDADSWPKIPPNDPEFICPTFMTKAKILDFNETEIERPQSVPLGIYVTFGQPRFYPQMQIYAVCWNSGAKVAFELL